MRVLFNLGVGVAVFVMAIFSPVSLVFLFLIWAMHKHQQAESVKIHEQYSNQKYELHFPEERIAEALDEDIEKAVTGGSNVIRFPKR